MGVGVLVAYLGTFLSLALVRYAFAGQRMLLTLAYPLTFAALFAFAAFRFEVGCDWTGYWVHFSHVSYDEFVLSEMGSDHAWWLLVDAVEAAGLPYPALYVAVTAIFMWGAHRMARREPDPLGYLMLLFPVLMLNIVMSGARQAVATGFAFMAYNAFRDRSVVRFCAMVGAGAMFHSSCAVLLLMAPLITERVTARRILLSAALALPGVFFLVTSEVGQIAAERYVGTAVNAAGAWLRVGFLASTGAVFFLVLRPSWRARFPGDLALATIGAAGALVALAVIPLSSVIADRLAYYAVPLQAMILARIPFLDLGRLRPVTVAYPWVGSVALLAIWLTFSSLVYVCYVPYRSWMFGFPEGADLLWP